MATEFNNYCLACAAVLLLLSRAVRSGSISYRSLVGAAEWGHKLMG